MKTPPALCRRSLHKIIMTHLFCIIPGHPIPYTRTTARMLYRKRQRKYAIWKEAAAWTIKIAAKNETMKTPVCVYIEIYTDQLNADGDNIEKGVSDSAKLSGIIPDDSIKYIPDCHWKAFYEKDNQRVEVTFDTV